MKTFSLSDYLFKAASILELLIGICVLILCVVCGLGMILPMEPLHSFGNAATIRAGLGNASYVIIGVEFIKMIASHKIEAVLDIIAFALSREMIIHETTPLENLLTVSGVVLLFFIRRFLNAVPQESPETDTASSE
ncbi:MAG: hypothetical protein PUE91_11245 [Clostridiales bacterium]|nr:hypothetical protein [Clostridiales bacterium]